MEIFDARGQKKKSPKSFFKIIYSTFSLRKKFLCTLLPYIRTMHVDKTFHGFNVDFQ